MTTTVNNIADKISLGKQKDGKSGMKFTNVYNGNEPIYIKIRESVVVFEPSVYNGTGDETRKGIVLEISEDDAKLIEDVERSVRVRSLGASDKWNSCVRRENNSVRVKAKIEMSGEHSCEFHGPGDEEAPSFLRGRKASVILHVKGLYAQRNASGLMIDVAAMRYGEKPPQKSFKGMLVVS